MSSDDEDELCRFGTPLDPIEEDEVPSAKKITLADQIAVDSNGKRRFHGAFTGGFAAGFWNTVGSREGWTPSEFKSSRGEKATLRTQKPSDFMDDEDVGEFGIAPQRIQATEDFEASDGRQKHKRKLASTSQGPIPGIPVLESVLESCHDKAAVRLLKRMDKKYSANLAEKEKKSAVVEPEEETMEVVEPTDSAETATETDDQQKVYKCDMGPIQKPSGSNEDSDDDDDDQELVFDDDEFNYIFENMKINRFGLSYVGLEKGNFFTTVGAEAPSIQNNFSILPTFTMVDQNKKKFSIKGQAFGVGAFEEDDDDIYGRDDMSKYDFRLENQTESSSSKKLKNVEKSYIAGFSEATKTASRIRPKNIFKVHLPARYEPRNWLKRKSRFGPEVIAATAQPVKGPSDKVIGRHDLTPDQRGQILGDKTSTKKQIDLEAKLQAAGLKSLNFTSGGVENESNQPTPTPTNEHFSTQIDETLTKIRNKSFVVPESIPQLFDRFTTSDSKPLSETDFTDVKKTSEAVVSETPKEVQKVIRTKFAWVPCQLLCYKMNMESSVGSKPEKGNTFSLFECIASGETARRNRLEFTSVPKDDSDEIELRRLEYKSSEKSTNKSYQQPINLDNIPLPPSSSTSISNESVPSISSPVVIKMDVTETRNENTIVKRSKPKTELEMKIIDTQNEHPSRKKDIFKAIFDSDSENESGSDTEHDSSERSNAAKAASINIDIMASLTKPSTSSMAMYAQLPDDAFKPKSAKDINILRNTSPPRGIFSSLIKKPESIPKIDSNKNDEKLSANDHTEETPDLYGPSLPPPILRTNSNNLQPQKTEVMANKTSTASISLGKNSNYKVIYEEKWIEKSDDTEKKSKKEKKHKKDRDRHKSKKHKKEKHKKKKR